MSNDVLDNQGEDDYGFFMGYEWKEPAEQIGDSIKVFLETGSEPEVYDFSITRCSAIQELCPLSELHLCRLGTTLQQAPNNVKRTRLDLLLPRLF